MLYKVAKVWQNHLRNEGCLPRSYREILDEARMHKHTHTSVQYHIKFKLKLLQIKCHVLEFIKGEAPKDVSKDNQNFCGSIHLSWYAHTLHPRRVWASSDDLHLRVPVGNPALIGLDLPLTALIGITRTRRNVLTCTQIHKNNKRKSLSDCSIRLIHHDPEATNSRHARTSSELTDSSLLAPNTNHF
jgi:hypothetical protein